MSEPDQQFQERRLGEILDSSADDAAKAQHIIHMGFDPEIADEIVERHHLGNRMPVYYETLDFADLDDEEYEHDRAA